MKQNESQQCQLHVSLPHIFSIMFRLSNKPPHVYRDAKSKALSLLNKKKPQFPPDVYYIRRNPEVLSKFLDNQDHITELQKD